MIDDASLSLEQMRKERGTYEAIYIQFVNSKKYFKTYAFCFYEGEDGKYYNSRISQKFGNKFITYTVGNKKEVFSLRVSGESMINVGIYDGDILIVERQNTAKNGDTVVAMNTNNEATVKTFYKENGHFRLQPENDTMEPIILDEVTILGKVIGLYRKL